MAHQRRQGIGGRRTCADRCPDRRPAAGCRARRVRDRNRCPQDSPLWDLPNLVMTPHMAGAIASLREPLGSTLPQQPRGVQRHRRVDQPGLEDTLGEQGHRRCRRDHQDGRAERGAVHPGCQALPDDEPARQRRAAASGPPRISSASTSPAMRPGTDADDDADGEHHAETGSQRGTARSSVEHAPGEGHRWKPPGPSPRT